MIKAVDEYADLMRISAASAGNDHRLGGNEAPPAIVSIFLGDELTAILKSIEDDTYFGKHQRVQLETGAHVLPHFIKDNTDRNRTSPFAFTGNKFEFRMLGSSASVAHTQHHPEHRCGGSPGPVFPGTVRNRSKRHGACGP